MLDLIGNGQPMSPLNLVLTDELLFSDDDVAVCEGACPVHCPPKETVAVVEPPADPPPELRETHHGGNTILAVLVLVFVGIILVGALVSGARRQVERRGN